MTHRYLAACSVAFACLMPRVLGAQVAPARAPFAIPFKLPIAAGNAQLRDSSFVGDAMAYRYEGTRITGLDVYVWPLPAVGTLNAAPRDSLLQLEVAKFKEAVPHGVRRGWYDSYRIAFDDPHPVAVEGDSLSGYVVALVYSRRRQPFASFFYIYAVKGMYFKIRLTVPGDGWSTNPALDVPAELVRAVAGTR